MHFSPLTNFVKPNALWQISRSCTSFFKVSCKEVFYSPFSTYFVTNLLQKILTRRLLSHYSLTSSNPTLYADSISFVCAFAQYPKEHRTIAPHKGHVKIFHPQETLVDIFFFTWQFCESQNIK